MAIISLLITVLIIALIAYVAWWALSQIPAPQPVRVVLNVALAIVIILVLAGLLTGGVHFAPLRIAA